MLDDHATLADELKHLRKGRGVQATNIVDRAGPALRRLCGIGPEDPPSTVRDRLTATLTDLAERLPPDLRLAALAAFALHPDASQPRLGERLSWLSQRLAKNDRTARRRTEAACARLAEIAAGLPTARGADGEGWYVRQFSALVRLDGQSPEVTESRTVVAARDGIAELDTEFSLPRHPADRRPIHDLAVTMLYGGRLVRRERPSESHFRFTVELPLTLAHGQSHDYAMRLRVPPGQPVRPHYLFVPHRRCDLFELRLRFEPSRVPRTLWRVTDSPIRVIDDGQPSGELLVANSAGEIHEVFPGPRQGFAYGVQWRA
ncbi:hypothetical protein [Actinophytocola xanthii]|uniref:Uncharacterized protein n=1 Tax=Actinophytocola xanthii TaxID=1912961 RepID=A0A1Q8CTK1_9PSEU|nr:hypothetical protein [Actinophytocola xanthii]OLF17698.1 hypothetical protein BU204_09325 [Actinophytocola xanthii]